MKEGDIAPNFILKDENGNDFELYKNLTKKILIVFYPKDETPVCSSQLSEYNKNLDKFTSEDIRLVGISADPVKTHSNFCSHLQLKFPLLADETKAVSRQYEALNFLGKVKRKLVLVNSSREILWVRNSLAFHYVDASVMLNYIRSLKF
jgi:peroxiredoxin